MVVCKRCGNENPMGRVFCTKCGTKLDLTHMSSDFVVEVQTHWYDIIVRHWPKAVYAIVVAALLMTVFAYWPQTQPLGKKGTLRDARKVETVISGLKSSGSRTYELTDVDINGYFENLKAKPMQVSSVSVVFKQGYFFVRVIEPIGKYKILSYQFEPMKSYDVVLQPTTGRMLRPVKVYMGRLKLFGPLKMNVFRKFMGMFAGQQVEWAALKNVTEVKSLEGKLSVTGGKK